MEHSLASTAWREMSSTCVCVPSGVRPVPSLQRDSPWRQDRTQDVYSTLL